MSPPIGNPKSARLPTFSQILILVLDDRLPGYTIRQARSKPRGSLNSIAKFQTGRFMPDPTHLDLQAPSKRSTQEHWLHADLRPAASELLSRVQAQKGIAK